MLPHSLLSPLCVNIIFIPKLQKLASKTNTAQNFIYIFCIKINIEYRINSVGFSKACRVFLQAFSEKKLHDCDKSKKRVKKLRTK